MRQCGACGKALTDAATFCPSCGAEAPLSATAPIPQATTGAAKFAPSPVAGEPRAGPPPRAVLIGLGLAVLLIALLFWSNRYQWLGLEPPSGNESAALVAERAMYVIASANLRDEATTIGSIVTGKLARGTKVTGVLQHGEDGSSQWYKLADGNFVSAVNLSARAPPALAQRIDKRWYAAGAVRLLARPQPGAAVLEIAEAGKAYQLIGLTNGGFAEVALGKGGVAYFDASGIDLAAASAPPIGLAFDPARCGFGNEIDLLLRKLGQDAQRRFQLAEASDYPDEEARDAALGALDSASAYLPLTRSYKGLGVGGIGAHYEASSVYFRESPDKIIAVFARDFPVAADGGFALDLQVGSSIRPSSGEARKYGLSELICGA